MALTIYGSHRSRTKRVLWTAAECGLDYTHVPVEFDDPWLKSPEFLSLNPAGSIPTIVDDGVAVSESLAINLYLARRHGAAGRHALWPATLAGEAEVFRWSLWAQGHLEPWIQRDALLADLRAAIGLRATPIVARALALLNHQLTDRSWLLGEDFTVADLNVAAVLSPSRTVVMDLSTTPNVRAWLDRCYSRPAALTTRERFKD